MALRRFALDSYARYGDLYNWEPRRLEGFVFHRDDAGLAKIEEVLATQVAIWRRDGEVIGWVIPEYPGGVYLQVHRDDERTMTEQIEWSVEHLAVVDGERRRIEIYGRDDDLLRQSLLREAGFQPTDVAQIQRSLHLSRDASWPERSVPDGFVVRSVVNPELEAPRMARLFNRAFNRNFHMPTEYANYARLAPSYRPELEIVVDGPDGGLASHVGLTAHEEESFLIVEPVCTDPDYEGLGLARAAMRFGLDLARQRGIGRAFIGADASNPVSNHTYESMGFADPHVDRQWRLYL